MTMPRSLQTRLALAVGMAVSVLWLAAALVTAHRLGHEMEEVFDKSLQATAERILPLAAHDLRDRNDRSDARSDDDEEDGDDEHITRLGTLDDKVSYVVRDRHGRILLRSDGADDAAFPPFERTGFGQTEEYRLYSEESHRGGLTITVAEPLDHRAETSRAMLVGMVLPLLVVIPLSLAAIVLAVRRGLRSVRTLRQGLAIRGPQDLSPLPDAGLPTELEPITHAVNQLLDRLRAAFEAERTFAANTAHELRTPIAGAIAQAQRLKSETKDDHAAQRAADIETTLKRLMRMSEKLMQLARAEGSRLLLDVSSDVRPVLRLIVEDFIRAGSRRINLVLPQEPVLSNLDPDALGILLRNLIENALFHGDPEHDIDVTLAEEGLLSVRNQGPVLPPETIERLMRRFERGTTATPGSGLGLAIVKAIADRAGMQIAIVSPVPGRQAGVEISCMLPV